MVFLRDSLQSSLSHAVPWWQQTLRHSRRMMLAPWKMRRTVTSPCANYVPSRMLRLLILRGAANLGVRISPRAFGLHRQLAVAARALPVHASVRLGVNTSHPLFGTRKQTAVLAQKLLQPRRLLLSQRPQHLQVKAVKTNGRLLTGRPTTPQRLACNGPLTPSGVRSRMAKP